MFLPNKTERYLAALRETTSRFINKNGIKPKYLKMLKIIYETEAVLTEQNEKPIDISAAVHSLFTAVYLKKAAKTQKFEFSVNADGNYILDKKIFTVILLKICSLTEFIELFTSCGKIAVRFYGRAEKSTNRLLEKINATSLYECNTNCTVIVFNFTKTAKKTADFEGFYGHLENPFSAVNLYL